MALAISKKINRNGIDISYVIKEIKYEKTEIISHPIFLLDRYFSNPKTAMISSRKINGIRNVNPSTGSCQALNCINAGIVIANKNAKSLEWVSRLEYR